MNSCSMNSYSMKFRKYYNRCKTEIKYYSAHHKKRIIMSCTITIGIFIFLRHIFFKNMGSMHEEYYNFINEAVDKCLQKKSRYEQNKEFALIKTSLPLKPLKMTLTTAVFLITDTNEVLKRVIVNKKTPIYEDKIALTLDHFNIVKSYKSDIRTYKDINNQTQTLIWLYMEYLPFKITQSYVKKSEDVIKKIAYDLLLGLQYLHSKNIAHLDLKIANIMGFKFNGEIRYKIIDFGYSRVVNKEIHVPGKNYGTFPYKAPEVVFKSIHGLKSDIWCVGAILLFLRMEQTPFYDSENKKRKDLYDKFLSGKYKMRYPRDISLELKDFIKACMRLNRDHRPSVEMLLDHKLFNEEGLLFSEDDESTESYDSGYEDETDESLEMDL